MIIQPLLLASAVGFWGLESGNLLLGMVQASLIAATLLIRERWKITDEDCIRVSDITSVLFLGTAAIILLNVEKIIFLKTLVIWQPFVLMPLILAQLYSGREKIIIGTHLGFRRKIVYTHDPLDFRIYYFFCCLLSAAMANSRSMLFYPGAAVLFCWLLLTNRSRAFPHVVFAGLFLISAGTGYFVVQGADSLHEYVHKKMRIYWRSYFSARAADPFQANLFFGAIGRLKTSGEILLRLKTDDFPPLLLKQASYETLVKNIWHSNQSFHYLPLRDFSWNLMPAPHPSGKGVTIEYYLPKEQGLLLYPYGSFQVKGETLYKLEQKYDGTTRIIDGAPLVTYDISYGEDARLSSDQPEQRNLFIPQEIQPIVTRVTSGWHAESMKSSEKVKRIRQFFADGFSYSLDLHGKGTFATPLERFLFGDRVGYCELFATATTLLLRDLGVPSRYVTGFAVSEYSRFEKKYIVRERHAHAWSEAYVDGRWLVVDTTPADWLEIDTRNRSSLEWLQDILAYLRLEYEYLRMQTDQRYRSVLSVLVVVLSLILLVRIYRRIKAKKVEGGPQQRKRIFPPIKSPFDQIVVSLQAAGIPQQENELLLVWIRRVNDHHPVDLQRIERLYEQHRRLRFDPLGMSEAEYREYASQVEEWLSEFRVQPDKEIN